MVSFRCLDFGYSFRFMCYYNWVLVATGIDFPPFLFCDQSQETQRLLSEPGEFWILFEGGG